MYASSENTINMADDFVADAADSTLRDLSLLLNVHIKCGYR